MLIPRHGDTRRFGAVNKKVVIGCCAGLFVFLFLAGGAGVGVGVWYWYQNREEAERKQMAAAFDKEIDSYLDSKNVKVGPGKFKGKVVCIDRKEKKVDEESLIHLPDALKATKPDEVGAVALITWDEEVVGDYPDGAKAKIYVASITLLDKKQMKYIVLHHEIRGEKKESKRGSGDAIGPKPWDKIVDFLKEHAE
jgi:hypothetical protein